MDRVLNKHICFTIAVFLSVYKKLLNVIIDRSIVPVVNWNFKAYLLKTKGILRNLKSISCKFFKAAMVNVLHIRLEAYAKEFSITSESQNGFRNSTLDYVLTLQTVFIRNPYETEKKQIMFCFYCAFSFWISWHIFFLEQFHLLKLKNRHRKQRTVLLKKNKTI